MLTKYTILNNTKKYLKNTTKYQKCSKIPNQYKQMLENNQIPKYILTNNNNIIYEKCYNC